MQSGGGGAGLSRHQAAAQAASPSSSSAGSTPHFGFDSVQQQQQQQQQQQYQHQHQGTRQSLQPQFLRNSEGNENFSGVQGSNLHAVTGANSFASSPRSMPQQSRMFFELVQQQGLPQDVQNRRQSGVEQQALNPLHQAYLQYAFQASQKSPLAMQAQHQRMGNLNVASGNDMDMQMVNNKMQEAVSLQTANQVQASSSRSSSEQFTRGEKQFEQVLQPGNDQRILVSQPPPTRQLAPVNAVRPMQGMYSQQSISNNQLAMATQMQLQAWARENNVDLSLPANANLVAQLVPLIQARLMAQHKANEGHLGSQPSPVPMMKPQVTASSAAVDCSPHANSPSDISAQAGPAKGRQTASHGPFGISSGSGVVNSTNNSVQQQIPAHGRENQVSGQPVEISKVGTIMQHPQRPANVSLGGEQSVHVKNPMGGPEALQMQYLRQLNQSSPQPPISSSSGGSGSQLPIQGAKQAPQQPPGFTKQQLHVFKAQILAFRRIKKGESTLPPELLHAIAPPPLELQLQYQSPPAGGSNQDKVGENIVEDKVQALESNQKDSRAVTDPQNLPREEVSGEEKVTALKFSVQPTSAVKEASPVVSSGNSEQPPTVVTVKSDPNNETIQKAHVQDDVTVDKGKAVVNETAVSDVVHAMEPVQANVAPQPQAKDVSARKYHGPLFDFPFFTRKNDSFGSGTVTNNNNLSLAYNVKDILFEEGLEVLKKKRTENLKKIGSLLAVNLERKRIRPDLVLRLQIEEKKLRLVDLQARLRDEVDQQQQEIMSMPDRPYRKFVRLCERQRMELARQVQLCQKAVKEKQLKSIFQWRKKLLESHWAIRDARIAHNRGVAKYHEKMLREFSKRKDDDRNKRMEALKNNDVERYREMLLEQQTNMAGDAAERYNVLSSFLTQTEEYLQKLGSKITSAKNQQEVEEAANAAASAARLQGLSAEEVRAAADCAREEVMIRKRFTEMNEPKEGSSVSKYYHLAHAVNERVVKQPSMLRAGTLRDYQLVGLQWMLSLYNNKLNGILADEMGLGKTVQVLALIAFLMEFKGNYGPHLIIVPNAVLVNWKSEFHAWLPSASCIFYVGAKDQRAKLFSQAVSAMKFNVLVTTYEFIMYDRSKLSKVDWKYIIIDEAQRMKDRESVLARDLDRYRCQRRLLLTGTPLQNDLKELWSLLNLLLPEVFDNRKAFHDWFAKPFQKEAASQDAEDDWLETEKKVIIIHRLHQILEPFMLRRRVEDVEGSLPPKVSIVLKCRMSGMQSAIYDWIKATGTLRVDPEEEKRKVQKNSLYQARVYRTLNNRCMELRKACNHPLLNYPYYDDLSKDFLVKSCGKLWILDRVLIKLHRTGHRVLLFSTMTKLLDILEEYLRWRQLVYRRIDGTTTLEDRESAIVEFNRPGSDCFIFLLSIRAAGRGLNLQSADTVVIYDPDPNPKNEEQAVARAHRIGQTREVKVIYMEAVVDKIPSHQKEDELKSGGTVDWEDDLAGKDRYIGSIESLIRNNIQQYKIDMADEVINAGRFDQRTTHEERRLTLETLLHDEERYEETVHDVPSLQQVNRMIARSEEEVELFDQMDEELDWIEEMIRYDQAPKWLRASTREVNARVATMSKKTSKRGTLLAVESSEVGSESLKLESKRGRSKKKHPNYVELEEISEDSSDERNEYSTREEEGGGVGEYDDDEEYSNGAPPVINDQSEEDGPDSDGDGDGDGDDITPLESNRNDDVPEEADPSGSSSDSTRQLSLMASPVSSRKFGSLSALESRQGSLSKKLSDELEEGEIAASGDAQMIDTQQSGSWIHERDEVEDDQVLQQPKIKRKRSIRMRPRHPVERQEEKFIIENPLMVQRGYSILAPVPMMEEKHQVPSRADPESRMMSGGPSAKNRRQTPTRKGSSTLSRSVPVTKPSTYMSAPADERSRENRDGRSNKNVVNADFDNKMSDIFLRKCKNVVSKFQRRIEKEGPQIVPLLMDLWKRSGSGVGNNLLDLRKIDSRVDTAEYNDVMELVFDVQYMLKGAMHFYGFNHEIRTEARKVHDLFFDILKIAFPNTDLQEARSALSFSNPAPMRQGGGPSQNKRQQHRASNDVDPHVRLTSALNSSRGESTRIRVQIPPKDNDTPPPLSHPGELVVCKKKRKEREKAVMKLRSGLISSPPSQPHQVGPSSKVSQQSSSSQGWPNSRSPSGAAPADVGWANPVKRLRTDAGKRRPSHL